jgi:hypothetical protein
MPDFSPITRAVWTAAWEKCPVECGDIPGTRRNQIAAALEAAADQVVPEEAHPQVYEDCCDYSALKARMSVRTQLLAIAAELRGQGDSNG